MAPRQVRINELHNIAQANDREIEARYVAGQQEKTSISSQWERQNRNQRRDMCLLDAVKNLDSTLDSQYTEQLIEWIRKTYQEMNCGQLLALFAPCHLGYPYIDHHMTLALSIVEHYQHSDVVPVMFIEARSLVGTRRYAFVEVYSDGAIVPIAHDGSVR